MSKRNRERRDILEDLEAEGKIAELVLLAWGMVELTLDNATLSAYGLSSQDMRARPLVKLPVADKLKLLKRLDRLSDEDYDTLTKFKDERNALFHMGGLFFPNWTEEQKKDITDLAFASADASHELSNRTFNRGRDRP